MPAVEEAVEIGEAAGIPVHILHLRTFGEMIEEVFDVMEGFRERCVDVTADVHPYIWGSTALMALLPAWVQEGGVEELLERLGDSSIRSRLRREIETGLPGWENFAKAFGWENIVVSYCDKNKDLEGKNLREIAEMRGVDPCEALFDLIVEEEASASMIFRQMSEGDVKAIMRHPAVNFCSDGIYTGKPHPRLYGSFARVLGRYVREERVLTLEEAVRKMTSLPAQRLGLADRGLIAEGMYADITIFDPQSVIDRATFEVPQQYPEGIRYVIVNGVVTVDNGEHIKALAGRVLRKGVTLSS